MDVPQPPKLLDRVRQAIRFRHFSRKTEKSYLYYIRDFILFHQKRHHRVRAWCDYNLSEDCVKVINKQVEP